jgi:hypothetical protein
VKVPIIRRQQQLVAASLCLLVNHGMLAQVY